MNIGELEPRVFISLIDLEVFVQNFYRLVQVVVVLVQTHQPLDAGRVGRAGIDQLVVNLLRFEDGSLRLIPHGHEPHRLNAVREHVGDRLEEELGPVEHLELETRHEEVLKLAGKLRVIQLRSIALRN